MLRLRVQAPFATFRAFAAGSFRPSAPFITYSAAYGLLLNLAGQEMRAADDGKLPMTSIASGLPRFELALGVHGDLPAVQSLYQQLHNYPVGAAGKERQESAQGNKYNITPARRMVLHRLDAVLALRGDEDLEAAILAGLRGDHQRYGLPFLGDNNFLPDRIEAAAEGVEARWLIPMEQGMSMDDLTDEAMRLTTSIDRVNMAHSRSGLFQPETSASPAPPQNAWMNVGY